MAELEKPLNVLGEPLETCSEAPLTGFFRDGSCNTGDLDAGLHTVCVRVTQKFLEFSRFRGNDLSTPLPEADFPGLRPGDQWCLCALRWLEAHEHGLAPKVYLARTHIKSLELIPLELLQKHAIDLN